jgi:hypothetical protein
MQPRQKFFSYYENFVVTASGNKLEKIAMSLIISAFHPKALNVVCETGRSSGSTLTYLAFPFLHSGKENKFNF